MRGMITLDIPEDCGMCIMRSITHYGYSVCQVKRRRVNSKSRPKWCPIKPIERSDTIDG